MTSRILVLDSNLLILFIVGSVSREYIIKHKRLQSYSEADYDLLRNIVSSVSDVVVTPHTLTETSNHLRHIGEPAKSEIYLAFRWSIQNSEELHITSRTGAEREEFIRLGLTDAVLLEVTKTERTLLTVDLDLFLAAQRNGYDAINFNHLREQANII